MRTNLRRLLPAALLGGAAMLAGGGAIAQDTVFLSTQLRPVEEATKMRQIILRDAPGRVTYVVDEPAPMTTRMQAELQGGTRTVSVVGAAHGELLPLMDFDGLEPVGDLAARLADRGIPAPLMESARLGKDAPRYIPWMQATYIMVADKRALAHLPAGADVNALTYAQLAQWGRNLQERTGRRLIGFPGGPTGLMNRFFQGFLYPSYTGGLVTTFRSAEAEAMWADFKALWATVNPSSTSYNFMQEPLMGEEVWVAFDHVARVIEALRAAPDRFVTFPAPAGPRGRGYMAVVAGLGIVKGAPNRAGAEALIEYMTRPATQVRVAAEFGFFPVVKAQLPADLAPGVKLAAEGVDKTQTARDALVSLLPIGLGARGGEFNKVFIDTFTRIVIRNEPIRAVLDAEAQNLRAIMTATNAPCWAPDPASTGACPVN